MNGDPVVLERLGRSFGDLVAVDGLSFSVRRGELFGLLGPDGAGKTTTLRMLAGVMRPTAGDAVINGVSIVLDPEGVKHQIAYMSQRFGLYSDLTVIENIQFYADLYRVPKSDRPARLGRLFAFSNLGSFQDRLAGDLSGGMKQKLGLCCALVHRPSVLLLDEPTFGVDPVSRRDLWLIIHEMVSEGTTAVVSTSYMDEAERFDRVALLYGGRLSALDTPENLQRGMTGEILVIRGTDLREARRILSDLPEVLGVTAFGDSIHLRVTSAERAKPAIESALKRSGGPGPDIRMGTPGMEDVFIERMTADPRGSDA